MRIKDKTLLITGGTSGVGRALVDALAPINKAVVVIARDRKKLEELCAEYNNIHPYVCDLQVQTDVQKTVEVILSDHPKLSVIINNAGIQNIPMVHDNAFDFYSITDEIMINLAAPIWISALTIRHLIKGDEQAAYINIASGLAYYPKKQAAVYCATKAGLHNFTTGLGYQLEDTNINVHSVILPIVDTPMTTGRGRDKLSSREAAQQIVRGVQRNRQNIYVGKAKWLPLLLRISPWLVKTILKNA